MSRVLATAAIEFRIALRNRWVAISIAMMAVFSLALAAAGSAPTGALGVDRLSVTVVSLTSLAVYLVPLVALLMSFDAIAGEIERGTLPLLLTYPAHRGEIVLGKFLAHMATLALALAVGYGLAATVTLGTGGPGQAGLAALIRLFWTSLVLGGTFLGIGYLVSALSRRPSGAAGLAIAVWLVLIVLYDLALLALVVADGSGALAARVLTPALVASPADAFRLYNLAVSEATAAAAGLAGAAATIPPAYPLASLLVWPLAALALAVLAIQRVKP